MDLDGLNYLAGKTMDFVNKSAMNGTILAHTDGQVPNLKVTIPAQDEKSSWTVILYVRVRMRCQRIYSWSKSI